MYFFAAAFTASLLSLVSPFLGMPGAAAAGCFVALLNFATMSLNAFVWAASAVSSASSRWLNSSGTAAVVSSTPSSTSFSSPSDSTGLTSLIAPPSTTRIASPSSVTMITSPSGTALPSLSKNFGYMLVDNQWKLAPAYDLAYSYKPNSFWVDQHWMTLNGKRDNFEMADFLSFEKLSPIFNEQRIRQILEEVIGAVSSWTSLAVQSNVPKVLIERVEQNLRLKF